MNIGVFIKDFTIGKKSKKGIPTKSGTELYGEKHDSRLVKRDL